MDTLTPVILVGDNLGKRHQYLNNRVNDAFKNNIPFECIRDLPEHSPIDRIFKIDLANKYRNVDYILQTLKDKDMLFVSRAMKCKWLVQDPQYSNIINGMYLEEHVFPEMLTTASNKMKHWIHCSLKDKQRCLEFYQTFETTEIDLALKFLPKCPVQYFLREMEWLPTNKVTPQLLKLFCEQSTKAAEVYIKKLIKDAKTDKDYMRHLQLLLKTDADLYFYTLENVYVDGFKKLNKKATKYIMKHHRHRFEAKSELYAARILSLPALARCLNSEQLKNLIIKLVKAEDCFGKNWFTYKFAQPLIKGVDPIERTNFAAEIFEQKTFGEKVQKLPYLVPSAPAWPSSVNAEDDEVDSDYEDYDGKEHIGKFGNIRAKQGGFYKSLHSGKRFASSSFDRLFDKYRFKIFSTTFIDLRNRIKRENSPMMRQSMILVLVSKTGGRPEYIEKVLQLMTNKHINEPPNLRASIVRSLVRRAAVWRTPNYIWDLLLELTHDLGLDGATPAADCHEGLHAVVLRYILNENPCPPAVWTAYLHKFSTFTEYSLNASELNALRMRLPTLLMDSAEVDSEMAPERLTQLLDALTAYRIRIDSHPRIITLIAAFASLNPSAAKELLRRLYDSGVARKRFFKENFKMIQTDRSYLNALRHDTEILTAGNEFKALIDSPIIELRHDIFLRKLAVYFGEEGGLALQYLKIVTEKATEQPHMRLARPIALLTGAAAAQWPTLPKPEDEFQEKSYRRMLTELSANEHLSRQRPQLKLESKNKSLKAMSNWLHTCSPAFLTSNMAAILQQPRLARLVLALRANFPGIVAETFPPASRQRGVKVFCIARRVLAKYAYFLPQDWDVLLPQIPKLNLEAKEWKIYRKIVKLNNVPRYLKPDYSMIMHQALTKMDTQLKNGPLLMITTPLVACMSNHVSQVDPNYVLKIIIEFLEKDFTLANVKKQDYYINKHIESYMKLIARFMLVSNSEVDQKRRLDKVCQPFLEKVRRMWNEAEIGNAFRFSFFCHFLKYLKYTRLFLDETESSLPVLEAVQLFCDEVSPIYKNFAMNYAIRLNIVYRNAVKLSFKERADDVFKYGLHLIKSRNLIAFNFGKMVAQDVEDLVSRYFLSIRPIYCNFLAIYLRLYSHTRLFIETVYYFIKGLIDDETKLNGVLMGLSLYNKLFADWYIAKMTGKKTLQKDLKEALDKIKAEKVKFFSNYSEICSCGGMINCCL